MKKTVIIDDFCQKFLDYAVGTRSLATVEIYRDNLEKFLDKFTSKKLHKITNEELSFFISTLNTNKGATASNRTKNIMHTTLSMLFERAVQWGYIAKSPMADITRCKQACEGTRPLTESEINSLLEEATPLQLAYLEVAILTGMRANALRNLKFSDIDWDQNQIKAINKGQGHYFIPMNDQLRSTLKNLTKFIPNSKFGSNGKKDMIKYLPRGDHQMEYVFCKSDGSPYKKGFRCLKKLYDKCGIKNVALHGLRKTFCTLLAKNKVHPKVAQQLMGHKTSAMTMEIYTYIENSQLEKAVNQLPTLK